MGILSRWRNLNKPRHSGSGKLWDNTNSPGAKGPPMNTLASGVGQSIYENFYTPGPNPEPYLKTAEWKDSFRQHMPPDTMQPRIPVSEPRFNGQWNVGSNDPQQPGAPGTQPSGLAPSQTLQAAAPGQIRIRETLYDAAHPAFIRTPQAYTPMQVYFNERIALPEFTTPSMPAHAVQTNIDYENYGWSQTFVQDPGMRQDEFGKAPPWLRSTPLNVKTTNTGSVEGHRSPIKNAKAPKRIRSGG